MINTHSSGKHGTASDILDRYDNAKHNNTFPVLQIYDPNNKRYEVPVPFNIPQDPAIDPSKRLYEVIVENSPFGIKVKRTSTGTIM